jgi:hypothetical protein
LRAGGGGGGKEHPNGQTVGVDNGEASLIRKRVVGRGKGNEMCGWMWVVGGGFRGLVEGVGGVDEHFLQYY